MPLLYSIIRGMHANAHANAHYGDSLDCASKRTTETRDANGAPAASIQVCEHEQVSTILSQSIGVGQRLLCGCG